MPKIIDVSPESIPVEVQASGLDLFDLSVKATPLTITWDKAALEAAVREVVAMYEDRIITEDEVPAIKTEMAGLNKLKDKLNAARRDIVGTIKAPVDEFDAGVKAITDLITKARAGLDEQVKEFERRDRDSRRAAIQFMIDAAKDKAGLGDFGLPLDERWLNKTAKTSSVAAEIENLCLKESIRRTEALQLERAKQDRVTLVGEAVKKEAERHGFGLPMGKFAPCLSLEISGDEAITIITQAFAAEAVLRATPPPQPTAPVAPRTSLTEVAPLPQAFSPPMPPASPVSDPDPWEMPTVEDTHDNQDPPFPSVERMSLTLSFSTEYRAIVLELLDSLRNVAVVTIN